MKPQFNKKQPVPSQMIELGQFRTKAHNLYLIPAGTTHIKIDDVMVEDWDSHVVDMICYRGKISCFLI